MCHDHPGQHESAVSTHLHDTTQTWGGRCCLRRFARCTHQERADRSGAGRLCVLGVPELLERRTQPVEAMWSKLHKWRTVCHSAMREARAWLSAKCRQRWPLSQLYPLLKLSYSHSGVPLGGSQPLRCHGPRTRPARAGRNSLRCTTATTPVAMDVMLTFKDQMYLWYGGVIASCCEARLQPVAVVRVEMGARTRLRVCDSGGAGWPNDSLWRTRLQAQIWRRARAIRPVSQSVFAVETGGWQRKLYNLKRKVFSQTNRRRR